MRDLPGHGPNYLLDFLGGPKMLLVGLISHHKSMAVGKAHVVRWVLHVMVLSRKITVYDSRRHVDITSGTA